MASEIYLPVNLTDIKLCVSKANYKCDLVPPSSVRRNEPKSQQTVGRNS